MQFLCDDTESLSSMENLTKSSNENKIANRHIDSGRTLISSAPNKENLPRHVTETWNVFPPHLVLSKVFTQARDTWSSSSTQEQEALISQKKKMGDRWLLRRLAPAKRREDKIIKKQIETSAWNRFALVGFQRRTQAGRGW